MNAASMFPEQMRSAALALSRIEFWVVAGVVGLSMLLPRLLPAAVLTAAVFLSVRALGGERVQLRLPAGAAVLALGLLSLAGLWASPMPEITRVQVLRLWSGIGLYFAVIHWVNSERRLRQVALASLLAGLALSAAAPFSVQWPVDKLPSFVPDGLHARFQLLTQDSIHPNVLGGTLALLIPLALAYLLYAKNTARWEQALAAVCVLGMGAALLISLSRGAVLAVEAGVVVLLALRGRWGWLALALASGLGALAVYRLGLANAAELALAGGAVSGIERRLEIWSHAVHMIRDFPFTGVGMGLFGPAADRLYPFPIDDPDIILHAHNLFLQVAVDLGLPGLLAWLIVLGTSLAAAWRAARSTRKQPDNLLFAIATGLLAGQAALIVHGLTDAVTWGMVRPAPLVWLLWGLCMAAGSLSANRPAVKGGMQ